MSIRIVSLTAFLISIIALSATMAYAEGPVDPYYIESIYLARNGRLTLAQQKAFDELGPDEQERIIRNYRRYKKLPKNQQEKLKNRYEKWQRMPPEKRQRLKHIYEDMKRVPSNKRRRR